ncbi:hypothetical protein RB596_004099 [Gaeumannomyces avenae]
MADTKTSGGYRFVGDYDAGARLGEDKRKTTRVAQLAAFALGAATISWFLLSPSALGYPVSPPGDVPRKHLPSNDFAAAIASCPGYAASNVNQTDSSLTTDLSLAGPGCNAFGQDIPELKLLVQYQTDRRLHVKIYDAALDAYQIQEAVLPSPENTESPAEDSHLRFHLVERPFSFAVTRAESGEVLFNTSREPLVFETQLVRLRTALPEDPNLYGLGEYAGSFRMPTENYSRTLWNADFAFTPPEYNLYGSHPVYYDHRPGSGTHAVFLRNANGMDVKIHRTPEDGQYLEYALLGGVLDFYFLAGPSPAEASRQYAEVVGLPAMQPYWALGIHQCKYGYWDVFMLAEVVANSSAANIPLDVLWSDIDSMHLRRDFTLDPERFPLHMMRLLVDTLHSRGQRFVTMLDAGIARADDYAPYHRGRAKDAFLKAADGSDHLGVQWPGVVVWPDFFAPGAQDWWTDEVKRWFDPGTGMDVDGLWNDMNEASNFCHDVHCIPEKVAKDENNPPAPIHAPRPNTGRPIAGFPPEFQPGHKVAATHKANMIDEASWDTELLRRSTTPSPEAPRGQMKGIPGRDLLTPPYRIENRKGELSDRTIYTNITNADGTTQYDTHNLYGAMVAVATRNALLARRPGVRPFVLTRSTFSGSGRAAAHWFGDNRSTWSDYRLAIAQMLNAAALQQMPLVGSDVCGFGGTAQEHMCARWATAAAFQPFFRNHADLNDPHQEFYLWPRVAAAARAAIRARYRLLDFLYTALRRQAEVDGDPLVRPLWFVYPADARCAAVETQWFLSDALLVSPVVDDDAADVAFYLPDDLFYDFWTRQPVRGEGRTVTRTGVGWDEIPVHVRGGSVVPLRARGDANSTAALRADEGFVLLVAPGLHGGTARGSLYLDDGESLDPGDAVTDLEFTWDGKAFSAAARAWGFETGLAVEEVVVLGQERDPGIPGSEFDEKTGAVTVRGPWPLKEDFGFTFS